MLSILRILSTTLFLPPIVGAGEGCSNSLEIGYGQRLPVEIVFEMAAMMVAKRDDVSGASIQAAPGNAHHRPTLGAGHRFGSPAFPNA